MVTLKTIQVILLCIACLSLGFAAGYLAPYRVTNSFINVDMEGCVTEDGEQDLFLPNVFPTSLVRLSRSITQRSMPFDVPMHKPTRNRLSLTNWQKTNYIMLDN